MSGTRANGDSHVRQLLDDSGSRGSGECSGGGRGSKMIGKLRSDVGKDG